MKTFKEFASMISEGKKSLYNFHLNRGSPSPYWTGLMRKRVRIGGITYTSTYKNGKLKFNKRMRNIIGKKRSYK